MLFLLSCIPNWEKNNSTSSEVDVHVDVNSPVDTGVSCTELGSFEVSETVTWFFWGGASAPAVELSPEVFQPACEGFEAISDVPWLNIEMASSEPLLPVTLLPDELVSGRHEATIQIKDIYFDSVLSEFSVQLSTLVCPATRSVAQRRALVIGVDGLDGEEFDSADTPNMDQLK